MLDGFSLYMIKFFLVETSLSDCHTIRLSMLWMDSSKLYVCRRYFFRLLAFPRIKLLGHEIQDHRWHLVCSLCCSLLRYVGRKFRWCRRVEFLCFSFEDTFFALKFVIRGWDSGCSLDNLLCRCASLSPWFLSWSLRKAVVLLARYFFRQFLWPGLHALPWIRCLVLQLSIDRSFTSSLQVLHPRRGGAWALTEELLLRGLRICFEN